MQKRNKRVLDYARWKTQRDRGDKADKKTIEQGEQFVAVNDTLKEELPRLFALTGKLVEACLNNFVQLQLQWQIVWRKKLSQAIDSHNIPSQPAEIINAFSGDYNIIHDKVVCLGICNGSLLAEVANLVNFLSPTTTQFGDDSSSRRPSTMVDSRNRSLSLNERSPCLPEPEFGRRPSGNYNHHTGSGSASNVTPGSPYASNELFSAQATPELPGAYRSYFSSASPVVSNSMRPSTSASRSMDESPTLPRLSVDTPGFNRLSGDSPGVTRPHSGSTYFSTAPETQANAVPGESRYSGVFSSAMPMSDSPRPRTPEGYGRREPNVLFLAASVYEFNIDRARREAGYPYLTYVAGEVRRHLHINYDGNSETNAILDIRCHR